MACVMRKEAISFAPLLYNAGQNQTASSLPVERDKKLPARFYPWELPINIGSPITAKFMF
jgi:hypothetical protein